MQLEIITPIKINLSLHITARNIENYHLLESLVVFRQKGDLLCIKECSVDNFLQYGRFAKDLCHKTDNIILKAKNLLQNFAKQNNIATFPVEISLQKNLPIASGIGGGSGDAAACLILLNEIWQLNLSYKKLAEISLKLGADVPCCLHYLLYKQAIYISGIGEKIEPIDKMPSFAILLINNLTRINTADIFKKFAEQTPEITPEKFRRLHKKKQFDNLAELIIYLKQSRNDLLPITEQIAPNIKQLLTCLQELKPLYHQMSGSGATCFAIFENVTQAQAALQKIATQHPNYFAQIV